MIITCVLVLMLYIRVILYIILYICGVLSAWAGQQYSPVISVTKVALADSVPCSSSIHTCTTCSLHVYVVTVCTCTNTLPLFPIKTPAKLIYTVCKLNSTHTLDLHVSHTASYLNLRVSHGKKE